MAISDFVIWLSLRSKLISLGIGQGRITNNLGTFVKDIDGALNIPDEKSITMIYELLDKEGIYLGASSALNVVAAEELAQRLGKGASFPLIVIIASPYSELGKTIVTVLCDGAYRYQTRLFSKQWLKDKNLYGAIPENLIKYAVLD